MSEYTALPDVSFGDAWSAAQHNQLQDNTAFAYERITQPHFYPVYVEDFLYSSTSLFLVGAAIASGGFSSGPTFVTGHPGIFGAASHVSNANSGYAFVSSSLVPPDGGLQITTIFSPKHTNLLSRMGMTTSGGSGGPTDGIYFDIATGYSLTGKTTSSSSTTTTGTSYTMTADLWYRATLDLNSSRTSVTFTLYLCTTGAQLWTDTCSTNIPATNVSLRFDSSFWYSGSPGGQQSLAYIDYFGARYTVALVR